MSQIVIVGADAAGMSAASGLKRQLGDAHEVVVFERGHDTSYSACGIPYWIAGDVESDSDLVARTAAQHRANGIDLRFDQEVTQIDLVGNTVQTSHGSYPFDHLVLATGAKPIRPDLPGIDADRIFGVQNLDDGRRILSSIENDPPRDVVIVGSGYIGIEMAEACVRRGWNTVVIDRNETPLKLVDSRLGERIAEEMRAAGVVLMPQLNVTGFSVDDDGSVRAVQVVGQGGADEVSADVVIVALGVQARTELAVAAGLPTGPKNALLIEPDGRVQGYDHIWAAGDCVATKDRISGDWRHIALGTHANKQGYVIAHALSAAILGNRTRHEFPGIVQTAITRFEGLEISRTGLSVDQAQSAGFDPVSKVIRTTTHADYMPTAERLHALVIVDRSSRRLLGFQCVGGAGAGLRVDAAAVAITAKMTIDDILMADLAYAPPFSSVWSPLQTAARAVIKELTD